MRKKQIKRARKTEKGRMKKERWRKQKQDLCPSFHLIF